MSDSKEVFKRHFLQVRDGSLMPQESLRRKSLAVQPAMMSFVQPLEMVSEEDWYEALIAAAGEDCYSVSIGFRYFAPSIEGAQKVFMSHLARFIRPLQDDEILGTFGGSIQDEISGLFFVGLFPDNLWSPEQFISTQEVEKILTSLGYEKQD